MLKIGFIQFNVPFLNIEKTIQKLETYFSKTKGFDIVVLPELANSGYNFRNKKEAFDASEHPEKSIFISFLHNMATKNKQLIVTGFNEKENDKIYNSSLLINSNGIVGKYRKVHLFMNEKNFFEPGNLGFPVFKVGDIKIGMLICFDWMFPEAWRILALKGADIICHPSNLVLPYAQKAIPGYAVTNRVYIITCNRIGTERGLKFTGQSIIANPEGDILYKAGEDNEEIGFAEIDINLSRNKNITQKNNVIEDRKPNEYGLLTKMNDL